MDNNWEKIELYKNITNDNNNINNNYYENKPTDYIFILAGGLKENGEINDFVKKRLDKGIELYNEIKNNSKNCKIIVMGGGTYHKSPFLNEDKFVIHESTSCAIYLNKNGIKAENIFREWSSYDTIANGLFAYMNFIIPLNIKKIYLITSEFHIDRTKTIFNYFNTLYGNLIKINYITTENYGIDKNILIERIKRENNSNINFKNNIIDNYHTLNDFMNWFYINHNAYKSIINYEINNNINKTY